MKTRIVSLKTGKQSILYKNEDTGEWLLDRSKAHDMFHIEIIEGTSKKARIIRKYYSENTIPYTRTKIREMINKDIKNIDLLYDTIINEILAKRNL